MNVRSTQARRDEQIREEADAAEREAADAVRRLRAALKIQATWRGFKVSCMYVMLLQQRVELTSPKHACIHTTTYISASQTPLFAGAAPRAADAQGRQERGWRRQTQKVPWQAMMNTE
jgi:hypothetical protein